MNNHQLPKGIISITGLGALHGYFPVKSWYRWVSLVFFFIFIAGAILVILVGIYDTYVAIQQHGPALIDDKLTGPIVIAFVMFAVGLLSGWGAYANWNKGVVAYERGFAYIDRKGIQIWHWEDMVSMAVAITRYYTIAIYIGTTHILKLYNRKNQCLVLADPFSKVEELANYINKCSFPLLYGRATEHYNSGEKIIFGPVAISKAGIAIGKKAFPWADVDEVSIHRGILKVYRKDGSWFSGASVASSRIHNLHVLLSIICQVTRVKVG